MTTLSAPTELDALFVNLPCVTPTFADPVSGFAFQMVMPLAFAIILTISYVVCNAIRPGFFCRDGLLNAIGEILLEFYIAITIAVFRPFDCYDHPNGMKSMLSVPGVVCGEADHTTLVTISVVAILAYPLNTIAITFLATWQHPRSMAVNDIGHLIRCHFLFNRWAPQSYWFSTISTPRNFLIAVWPMVIPESENAVAMGLMTTTLILPLLATTWYKPRRTPMMNRLDMWISYTQASIMAIGSMSAYGAAGQQFSVLLSWGLVILTSSVWLIAGILLLRCCLQIVTKGKSPGSWAFDVFIDHHAGSGAITARSLQMILYRICKGKVFYDVDEQLQSGSIGVICDAVKLSKHCLIVLSNETWCKSWCVGAILSGVLKNIPIQTIVLGGRGDACFQEMELTDEAIDILAKQAPRDQLRPIGIADNDIFAGMKRVLQIKPWAFDMNSHDSLNAFLENMLQMMTDISLKEIYGREGAQLSKGTTEFFSKTKIAALQTNQGGQLSHAKARQSWFQAGDAGTNDVKSKSFVLLVCDSSQPDGHSSFWKFPVRIVSRTSFKNVSKFHQNGIKKYRNV